MILGIDYTIRSDMNIGEKDTIPIEILIEPYKGVIIAYQTVQILEGEDQATVRFDYKIIEKAKFKEKKLREDQYFKQVLGMILNTMIISLVDSGSSLDPEPDIE